MEHVSLPLSANVTWIDSTLCHHSVSVATYSVETSRIMWSNNAQMWNAAACIHADKHCGTKHSLCCPTEYYFWQYTTLEAESGVSFVGPNIGGRETADLSAQFLGAFAEMRRATTSIFMSALPSVHMELGSHWTEFDKIWYLSFFFSKICRANSSFIKIRQK